MSADLFAEFGDPNASSQSTKPTENVLRPSLSGNGGKQLTSEITLVPASGVSSGNFGHEQDFDDFGEFVSSRASLAANEPSTSELFRNDEAGSSVLFDVSTEEPLQEEDEWGEFESADQPSAVKTNVDLLGLGVGETNASSPNIASEPTKKLPATSRTAGDLVDLLSSNAEEFNGGVNPAAQKSESVPGHSAEHRMKPWQKSTLVVEESASDEEDWAEFADGPVPEVNVIQPQPQRASVSQVRSIIGNATVAPENVSRAKTQASKSDEPLRPTNIPPPSILLPLFSPLLEQLHKKAANFISSMKGNSTAPANPDLVYVLSSSSKVMTRIVAGRTLRWKRDSILSQSTKIGPARSGKAGGMKLSSVNKNETVKEEQAASEAMEAWRKRGTVLNNAISAGGGKPVPVPVGNVHVRTATAEEGAFKASHACALCGLKRDERIPKIDDDVYDSFGEFWIDYWGHSDCKVFWETNSASLDQR